MDFKEFIDTEVKKRLIVNSEYQKIYSLLDEYHLLYNKTYATRNTEDIIKYGEYFPESYFKKIDGNYEKKLKRDITKLQKSLEEKDFKIPTDIYEYSIHFPDTATSNLWKKFKILKNELFTIESKAKLDKFLADNDNLNIQKLVKKLKKIETLTVIDVLLENQDEPCVVAEVKKAQECKGIMDKSLRRFTGKYGDSCASKAYMEIYRQAKEISQDKDKTKIEENRIPENSEIITENDTEIEI